MQTIDRQRLIAEVFKRPALWDIQSEEYKPRENIPELWKEVAVSVGPEVAVDECKRKWKNLRDAYRAEVKRIEIRIEKDVLKGTYKPSNQYKSKWIYFDHMKFMKNTKRSRRTLKENANTSSNDNYDDDDSELNQFSEFHNVDNIKLEPDADNNIDIYTMDDDNDTFSSQPSTEDLLTEVESQQQAKTINSQPSTTSNLLKFNSKPQKRPDDKPQTSSCSKCIKRSYNQMSFLENLEKQEQNLIKSTRLDMKRSNALSHVGDSDYNFLVSFLPQLKKMSELQNLKFRAKMTDTMLTIMSETLTNNVTPASSWHNITDGSNN